VDVDHGVIAKIVEEEMNNNLKISTWKYNLQKKGP